MTDSAEATLDAFADILANEPGPLEPTDDRYVTHLHGNDSEDVIAALVRTCKRTRGSALYYFGGQRGTGKSTELRRLATLLNGERNCRAYLVDALEYISDSHPIELIDLLLVSVIAFADRLKAVTGEDFLTESVGKRLGMWLQTEVDIASFSVAGVRTDFKKQQQSLIQRIRGFDLARQERFVDECREFMRELSQFVRQRHGVEKVVLIVDSLERLRGVGSEASTDMFDRVVKVFDGGNTLDLPKRSDLPVAARFFDIRAVLNYRNGIDWVDLNPPLWRLIDGWVPPVPAAEPPSHAVAA